MASAWFTTHLFSICSSAPWRVELASYRPLQSYSAVEIEKKKKILKFVFLWLPLIKTTFDRVQGGKHPRFEGSMSEGGERLGAFVSTTISCADPETGLLASSLMLGTLGKSLVRHGKPPPQSPQF